MNATDTPLATRLKNELHGEVLFDAASRGRYSTDASIYQIEPVGVVIPQTEEDATTAMQIALDAHARRFELERTRKPFFAAKAVPA